MCIFSFSRLYQIVFASGYTNLFSQQCMKVPFVPHLYQHTALSWSFSFCHHSRYVMMSPCHFNLHFLMTVSHMFIWHLDILSGLLLLGCLLFLLTYRSSLYISRVWVLCPLPYVYCKYLLFSFPFHSYWYIMINSG